MKSDVRPWRKQFFRFSWSHSSNLDITKHQYRSKSSKLSSCLKALDHCTSFETADQVITTLKSSQRSLPQKVYLKLLTLTGKFRNVDRCRDILWELNHKEKNPGIEIYNAALRVAERTKELDFAFEIWDLIETEKISPNRSTYKILFSILSKLSVTDFPSNFPMKRIRLGEKLIQDMHERGLDPDLSTYIVFIRLLGEAALLERIFEIEKEVEDRGLVRTPLLYTTIMKACKRADDFGCAIKYFEKSSELGLVDSGLCNSALEAYHSLSMFQEVESLWKSLRVMKVKRNVIGFNIVIKSWAAQGRITDIEKELEKEKFKLDKVFYGSVIHELYHRGFVEESLRMFERGYTSGVIKVYEEKTDRLNFLDLHIHNTAVACCAVRYFLMKRAKEQNDNDLKIIVGRQLHSGSACVHSLGDVIRDLLMELGLNFKEKNLGGLLVVLGCEVKWLSHVPSWILR